MPNAVRSKKSRPSVSIIGSGRLGTALALALSSSGYSVQALMSQGLRSAKKAAALVRGRALSLQGSELNRLPASKIILIATPDDQIARTATKLASSKISSPKNRVVLHTSGALSSSVLKPLANLGFHVGSLHPLVSVSDPEKGQQGLRGAFYCIEGDATATRVARALVKDLGGRSFKISSEKKPLYHAAAVMASGHVLALYDLATDMLVRCGLKRSEALRILLPLLESTVNNLSQSDPSSALTGTFARGDIATVRRHLEALSKDGLTQALEIYKLLGARSLELGVRQGLEPELVKQIIQTLSR
ncbi:MAG TPA: Rossmann-like and DUF2520 domain-containing protein [Pyrinomonadaceae bacterium]|nr:Rossmann-like and DUF2520 domain-containing protein [Pyrinomonadaceae bacterium]